MEQRKYTKREKIRHLILAHGMRDREEIRHVVQTTQAYVMEVMNELKEAGRLDMREVR